MRTTLDLDEKLVAEAMKATGAPSKTAVVTLGLKTLVAQAARRRLAALQGRLPELSPPPRRRGKAAR